MPALPKLRIDALAELARQLRYESPEAARRQLERAEALILEILAECGAPAAPSGRGTASPRGTRTYPLEYIIFRITGLRRDIGPGDNGAPVVLVGDALLADLPALIERLSAAARISAAELAPAAVSEKQPSIRTSRMSLRARPERTTAAAGRSVPGELLTGPWLSIDQLSARWSVGTKTIERLRRRGLPARRVRIGGTGRGASVRERLVFSETAVRAFEAAGGRAAPVDPHTGRRSSQSIAAQTPRLTPRDRARIVARAGRYRARLGWSLNRCASRIAAAMHRSPETIRRVLHAHDAAADTPIFDDRGQLTDHDRAVLERSQRAGSSPTELAHRVSRARSTVYRIAADRRAERLAALDLDAPVGPLFDRPDAAEVMLGSTAVRSGLGDAAPASVGEFVAVCDAMEPPAAAVETARAVAYCYLRHRAREMVRNLPRHGAAPSALDEIETALRWASRVKVELVRSQLPTALRSLRARLDGRGPETLSPRGSVGGPALIDACVAALIDAVDRFDPFKALAGGGRLAAPATIAVNRALTRWLQAAELVGRGVGSAGAMGGSSRAAHKSEAAPLNDWTLCVDPWQDWLEPPEPLMRSTRAARAAPPAAVSTSPLMDAGIGTLLLQMRFGLLPTGAPPMTIAETARALAMAPSRVSARERLLIAAAAGGGGAGGGGGGARSVRKRSRGRE